MDNGQLLLMNSHESSLVANKEALEKLVEVFQMKNKELNLSSFHDAETIWQKHVVDSLEGCQFLTHEISHELKILDVGAGGGFPTLPLAMTLPDASFTAFDSVAKKMTAVQNMADQLELPNVQTLVGRCEDIAHSQKHRQQYDVVMARALAKWPTLLELTVAFAKVGGKLVYYLGPSCEEYDLELAYLFDLHLVEQKKYSLASGEERHIWVFEKLAKTSKKWPRENGVPKKTPVEVGDF